jgi:hypothetical protein
MKLDCNKNKDFSLISYAIMKTLSCPDAGCDCDYVAKSETEEDVLSIPCSTTWYERTWKNRQRYDSNAR